MATTTHHNPTGGLGERIPVARPRAPRHQPVPGRRSIGAEASGAGATIIAITAIFAAAGLWTARQIDPRAQIAGALAGGLLGLIAAFTGAYVRYRDL